MLCACEGIEEVEIEKMERVIDDRRQETEGGTDVHNVKQVMMGERMPRRWWVRGGIGFMDGLIDLMVKISSTSLSSRTFVESIMDFFYIIDLKNTTGS